MLPLFHWWNYRNSMEMDILCEKCCGDDFEIYGEAFRDFSGFQSSLEILNSIWKSHTTRPTEIIFFCLNILSMSGFLGNNEILFDLFVVWKLVFVGFVKLKQRKFSWKFAKKFFFQVFILDLNLFLYLIKCKKNYFNHLSSVICTCFV